MPQHKTAASLYIVLVRLISIWNACNKNNTQIPYSSNLNRDFVAGSFRGVFSMNMRLGNISRMSLTAYFYQPMIYMIGQGYKLPRSAGAL